MSLEKLALLRALANRPSRNIAHGLRPLLEALSNEGLLVEDVASGWSATAAGCAAIEQSRDR